MNKCFIFLLLSFFFCLSAYAQIITTIAGNGTQGYGGDGGLAVNAELSFPLGVAVDDIGNIYIADRDNKRVRKISTSGIITTIAGNGILGYSGDGGPATSAEFDVPFGVAVDKIGNVYVTDESNARIRKIDTSGIITTVAGDGGLGFGGDGGAATAAQLYFPMGVAVDASDNLYVADAQNNRIRKVNASGIITTIAGTGISSSTGDGGPATSANINEPVGITIDKYNNIYFCSYSDIRKVDTFGIITTVAGISGSPGYNGDNNLATLTKLNRPYGLAIDNAGNLFIADQWNNRIRKINTSGIMTTIAGTDSAGYNGDNILASAAELNTPSGICVDNSGGVYVADLLNNRIRHIISNVFVNAINQTDADIKIYPNPDYGQFVICVPSGIDEQAAITITTITGERIKELTAETNKPVNVWLDVPSGVYFMSAVATDGVYNKELMVRR